MEITQITSADLLNSNVTIIAGILVLLTISVAYRKDFTSKFWGDPILYIGFLPVFFIVSIGFLLNPNPSIEISQRDFEASLTSFQIGLGQLMVTVILITVLVSNRKKKTSKPQNTDQSSKDQN